MATSPYTYDANGNLIPTPGAAPGTPGSADTTAPSTSATAPSYSSVTPNPLPDPNQTGSQPIQTPTAPNPMAPDPNAASSGQQGQNVQALQQWLVNSGYLSADQMATGPGTYGPHTTAAVAALQKSLGLNPTGQYDQNTINTIGQKYQGVFNSLQGTQPQDNEGAAMSTVGAAYSSQSAAASDPIFSAISSQMAPIMNALQQTISNLNNPTVTGASAQEYYNQLAQQAGLPQMQSELLNWQNVMNWTEDDIRDQVTQAGGGANESQILAMTAARNKTILKQYSAVSANYQAAQSNIQAQMQYYTSDQSLALQKQSMTISALGTMEGAYQSMASMGVQMQQYQASAYQTTLGKIGYVQFAAQIPDNMKSYVEAITGMPPGLLSNPSMLAANDAANPTRQALKITGYDANGNPIYGIVPKTDTSSTPVSTTGNQTIPSSTGGSTGGSTSPQTQTQTAQQQEQIEYGLLSKVPGFNPNTTLDQQAAQWLNTYIYEGKDPTAQDVGLSSRTGTIHYMTQIKQRALDLLAKTGQSLPDLTILQNNKKLVAQNNALLNTLSISIPTIQQNTALLQKNLSAGNINQNAPLINAVITPFITAFGNTDSVAAMAQLQTLGNEVGSLLALKGASGSGASTVHDKLVASGLISKNSSAAQEAKVVQTLLQEASNAVSGINSAQRNLYAQVDPLQKDPQNPINVNIKSILGQGGKDNGNGTYTLPDGTIVTP